MGVDARGLCFGCRSMPEGCCRVSRVGTYPGLRTYRGVVHWYLIVGRWKSGVTGAEAGHGRTASYLVCGPLEG